MLEGVSKEFPIIAWWSGGADSAWTCYLCLLWYGKENVRVIFIDTKNEDEDTHRFKRDCEKWWGVEIETITNDEWDCIEDVWEHYLSLNVATGAICSTELKRIVRQDFQMRNNFSYQAFGFDIKEIDRARGMKYNYPDSRPFFPLIYKRIGKGKSLKMITDSGITVPLAYILGLNNNNCLLTGCVKGGIGYWQLYRILFPDRFAKMAAREHRYTYLKGEPVTICKDQSKAAKARNDGKAELVFLVFNPKYPHMKDITMIKGRQPKSLMDCNGFCGTNNKLPKRRTHETRII